MNTLSLKKSVRLILRLTLLVVPLVFLLYGPNTKPAAAATLLPGFFNGEAYGSWVNAVVLPVNIVVGKTALTPCPCLGTNGQTLTNQLISLNAGPILKTGVVKASVMTTKNENKAIVTNSSEIAGLNLLNGLITADVIKAATKTVATKTNSKSNDNGSTFVNLKIAGNSIVDPTLNAKIDLAGVGYVLVRETTNTGNGLIGSGIQIRMIHVFVTTQNTLGLPIGADIIVGYASSGYYRSEIKVVFGGAAFAEDATSSALGVVTALGHIAPVYVPCRGTDGATLSNTITSVKSKDLLAAGVGTSTAVTNTSGNNGSVRTVSTVEKIKLLNGLVTADSVIAVAESSYVNGQLKTSTDGSKLANLKILGLPVNVNVAPKTKKNLLGFGYVVLKEVKESPGRVSVNMIHLYITTQNILHIPIGTEVQIGIAESSIAPITP